MRAAFLTLAALLSGIASAQLGQKTDTQTEIELGRAYYDSLVQGGLRSRNETYIRRVDRIFAQLLAAMPNRLYPYQVVVIASNAVNAVCVPGGYVAVYEGLIATMPDDNQLAFVLAHELGHGAKRHWARRTKKIQNDALVGILIAGLTNTPVNDNALAIRAIGHGRHNEREADDFGTELYLRAGFAPEHVADGMRALVDEERRKGGGHQPEYLSTHPETGKRVESIEKTAQKLRDKGLHVVDVSTPEITVESMFGKIPTLAPTTCQWVSAEPGEVWEYEIQAPGATTRYQVRCVGVATVGLTPVARMEMDFGASPVTYQVIFDGNHVWRRNRPGKPESVWLSDIAFPQEGAVLEAGKKRIAFEALENVETPAGKFTQCLKVRIEEEGGRKTVEWYAPGVGLVRRTHESSGITETLVALKRP